MVVCTKYTLHNCNLDCRLSSSLLTPPDAWVDAVLYNYHGSSELKSAIFQASHSFIGDGAALLRVHQEFEQILNAGSTS